MVEFEGERITLQDFATRLRMPYTTLHSKLDRGLTPEQIATGQKSTDTSGSYRPLWAEGDEAKFGRWRSEYAEWLKRRVRPDARGSAPPELYDILSISSALDRALKRLESPAFEELTPAEYAAEADRWKHEQRVARHAPDWIVHARERLAAKDPALARTFVPRQGFSYRDFWRHATQLEPWKERP